jgi:hypothetical protein
MSMTDVKTKVEAEGGVASFQMGEVRDAHGAGRLGVHVRSNISKALSGMGLGHFPQDLPDSQYAWVRIYKLGGPVADLIDAVLTPGKEGDDRLRETASGDAEKILSDIRELVCA